MTPIPAQNLTTERNATMNLPTFREGPAPLDEISAAAHTASRVLASPDTLSALARNLDSDEVMGIARLLAATGSVVTARNLARQVIHCDRLAVCALLRHDDQGTTVAYYRDHDTAADPEAAAFYCERHPGEVPAQVAASLGLVPDADGTHISGPRWH